MNTEQSIKTLTLSFTKTLCGLLQHMPAKRIEGVALCWGTEKIYLHVIFCNRTFVFVLLTIQYIN